MGGGETRAWGEGGGGEQSEPVKVGSVQERKRKNGSLTEK